MSAAHTPGPWEAFNDCGEWTVIKSDPADPRNPWFVATCMGFADDGDPEANARVIAAAPALLEALDFMVNVSRSTPGFSAMAREQAERALSLAKGESA